MKMSIRWTRLGAGPAVTLMDRSMVTHPGMLRLLQDTRGRSRHLHPV